MNDVVPYCCGKSHVENAGGVGSVEWNANNTNFSNHNRMVLENIYCGNRKHICVHTCTK